MFTFSVKVEKWSFHVADLPRTGKKCSEIIKGRAKLLFLFIKLNMQNLWRCRCRRAVLNSLISYKQRFFGTSCEIRVTFGAWNIKCDIDLVVMTMKYRPPRDYRLNNLVS